MNPESTAQRTPGDRMPDLDVGAYHQDAELVKRLEEELYANHAPITLPPEYAEWVQDNLLRFLIRLARYKFVARLLSSKDRCLEVGCGSGLGSIFLAQHCAHVTGLDVKQYELDEARSMLRRDNVDFVRGDFFEYEPQQSFDSIVALDVIEHMPPEAGSALLARMASVLDDTGMAVIGTPSSHSYPHQSEISQASHVKCYDLPELQELVAPHFGRVLPFSMNDEIVHTGHPKMAWYYFLLCLSPKRGA